MNIIRYSAVRRQGEPEPNGREPKIFDYQTQQAKLLPALALAGKLILRAKCFKRRTYRRADEHGRIE